MTPTSRKLAPLSAVTAVLLCGCAANLENVVATPRVQLTDVQVMGLGFKSQTFLLTFDVHNPNPFSLPISAVSYAVRLDGQRFASGNAPSKFSISAGGNTQFAISVDLDLLNTAPQLLSVIRQGARKDIGYELEGRLTVGIPLTPPVAYRTSGTIRLDSDVFSSLERP